MASITGQKALYRLNQLIGDYSLTDPKVPPTRKLDALDEAFFSISGKLPGYIGLNATIVSLLVGTDSYALSGEYHSLNQFQLASLGTEVVKVSMPTVMRYRSGNASPAKGDPLMVAFTETAAGVATAEVWPQPVRTDSIVGLRALAPAETFRGQMGADLSAVTISFGVYGIEAFLYLAAARCLPIGPDRADMERLSAEALYDEKVRISRQRSSTADAKVM